MKSQKNSAKRAMNPKLIDLKQSIDKLATNETSSFICLANSANSLCEYGFASPRDLTAMICAFLDERPKTKKMVLANLMVNNLLGDDGDDD